MSFRQTLPRLGGPSSRQWLQRQFLDPYVAKKYESTVKFRSRSAFKLLELEQSYRFLMHKDVRCIVDLGAAPGGWSQVLAHKLGWLEGDIVGTKEQRSGSSFGLRKPSPPNDMWSDISAKSPGSEEDAPFRNMGDVVTAGKRTRGLSAVVALDKLRMDPIPGVSRLQMDFLSPEADAAISSLVEVTSPESKGKVDVILSDMAANMTGNKVHDSEASLDIAHAVLHFCRRHLRTAKDTGRSRAGVLV